MYKRIAEIAARLLLVIGWIVLLAPQAIPTLAQSEIPVTPIEPVVPSEPLRVPETPPLTDSASLDDPALLENNASLEEGYVLSGKGLKAVVFVGPIDGDTGKATIEQVTYAKQTAAAMRAYGMTVYEFYPDNPKANWANIKIYAQGAHFLVYRGHGVAIANTNPLQVGGLWLRGGEYVSNDQIRAELRPANNFIVMMYGSYTAGSTSGDTVSINLDEAKRRVTQYSDPFFDVGAGAYYADWFGDAFTSYLNALMKGNTHRYAYTTFYDYTKGKLWTGPHPTQPSEQLWMGWDEWYDPKPQWNNVFIGQPDVTLQQMFGLSKTSLNNKLFVPYIKR